VEKKANKAAFKEEKSRQEKLGINAARNTSGVKLL
jgi:hypothetical protein